MGHTWGPASHRLSSSLSSSFSFPSPPIQPLVPAAAREDAHVQRNRRINSLVQAGAIGALVAILRGATDGGGKAEGSMEAVEPDRKFRGRQVKRARGDRGAFVRLQIEPSKLDACDTPFFLVIMPPPHLMFTHALPCRHAEQDAARSLGHIANGGDAFCAAVCDAGILPLLLKMMVSESGQDR